MLSELAQKTENFALVLLFFSLLTYSLIGVLI